MPALRTRDKSTLEVSTNDTLLPPTLAIISPTPRAFTFPITHNLTDSPYSSPSHSPFEPDLRSLALTSSPPPSRKSSSPAPSHRRRKSSCSSDTERRPKKGDEDYIKRPENAFILFRRKCCEDHQESNTTDGPTKKQRQADLSKAISAKWKNLTPDERQVWVDLATERKKEHEARYPGYVYRPQRARDRDGRPRARKARSSRKSSEDDLDADNDSLSFVVPVGSRHYHGRSASAPTPSPHQFIQVPSVYQMAPSCPTSPSLLPMISRRTSHPDHTDERMFDFHPDASYAPHDSYASLQSSEFLQSMFNMAGLQRDTLHPLDIPAETVLYPTHTQHLSPSSSSGISTPDTDLDLDLALQMEMQLQNEYAQFSWPSDTWGPTSNTHTDLLLGTDFDLGAIPPIELDMPKCDPMSMSMSMMDMGYAAEQGQEQEYPSSSSSSSLEPTPAPTDFSGQGILAFDQMMAGHHTF